jgi:hypothetical protein
VFSKRTRLADGALHLLGWRANSRRLQPERKGKLFGPRLRQRRIGLLQFAAAKQTYSTH